MNTPFLTLLQAALLIACIVVELHPRIRTGPLACTAFGAVALTILIRVGNPAGLGEYLLTAALLALVLRYAHTHRQPARRLAKPIEPPPYNPWRITP